MTLRYLAGGSVHDIRDHALVGQTTFYNAVETVLSAINSIPQLDIKFPQTSFELEQAAAGFARRSSKGAFLYCIGAVDGWLLKIIQPRSSDILCGILPDYMNGHYQAYGMNVQATCDSFYRFTGVSILFGGACSDYRAFSNSGLYKWISTNLKAPYHLVGDAAYCCEPFLLTPFTGSQKNIPENSAFNFYLSQLIRICIEQSFGIMVNRWCILRAPLKTKLNKSMQICQAIMKLHNYIITKKLERNEN
ncbi:unnamed protein product, partial [Heterosigma akashiwo]